MTLETKNLRRVFKRTVALEGLSLTLKPGDVVALVGPNGSGKTTLMSLMAGLDRPTAGDVLLDGRSVFEYPEEAARVIGFMPDSLPNQSDVSAHEYVDFFARAAGLRGAELERRVAETEAFVNLGPIADKVLSALSKGMKQRVSLARALVHDPAVLILDEPASGLDPRARLEFRQYVKRLAEKGKTLLIASHILSDLEDLCNGCLILERGRLVKRIEGSLKGVDLEAVFMENTAGDVQ